MFNGLILLFYGDMLGSTSGEDFMSRVGAARMY